MPTTPLDGSGDWANWLQSLIASQGAAQPSNPAAYPAAAPQAMPGSGVMGMSAMTPGSPSMGYPAMGQNAGRPSVAPGMQQPAPQSTPWLQFGGFHPGNILQSHPPGSPTLGPVFNASGSPGGPGPGPGGPGSAGNDAGFNNPYQAAANAPMVPGAPLGQGGIGSDARFPIAPTPMGQGGIGSDARFPIAGPLAGQNQPTQSTGPMDPSIIARKKLMKPASTPASTTTAPPSAASSNMFGMMDRPNMSATGYNPGAPKMTVLDLARLFGRA